MGLEVVASSLTAILVWMVLLVLHPNKSGIRTNIDASSKNVESQGDVVIFCTNLDALSKNVESQGTW